MVKNEELLNYKKKEKLPQMAKAAPVFQMSTGFLDIDHDMDQHQNCLDKTQPRQKNIFNYCTHGTDTYLDSTSSCSSSIAILASRVLMEDLYLDLMVPSSSCSLSFRSLFWRSSWERAPSSRWVELRSADSSVVNCSLYG